MSSGVDVLISLNTTSFTKFCVQSSTITLLYFDYILTLTREVQFIWGSRFRLSTLLYICCRYALVANVLYILIIAEVLEPTKCHILAKFISSLSVLGRTSVIVTFTARTWAVWGSSKLILAFLGSIGTACIILDIVHIAHVRCGDSSETPFTSALFVTMMCVFEFCSTILTIVRCYLAIRAQGQGVLHGQGFFHLILEQGALYFLFTSLFTVAATVLSHNAPPSNFFQRLMNALVLPLSGILTARFLLHLRYWEAQTYHCGAPDAGDSADQHHISTSNMYYQPEDDIGPIEFTNRDMPRRTTFSEFGDDIVETFRTINTNRA